jgi:mannan endo-1,6-alpha-mannosidase
VVEQTNGSPTWKQRLDGLLQPTFSTFFPTQYGGNVMSEVSCETVKTCDRNMICFKGFLSSWLTFTSLLAPYTYNQILPKLQASAQAAAKSCTGGTDGAHCGITWANGTFDGFMGLEEQMSVLSVLSSTMVAYEQQKAPLTAKTGGNSTSNPNAGLGDSSSHQQSGTTKPITTADRAGAGIVTALFLSGWVGIVSWMVFER